MGQMVKGSEMTKIYYDRITRSPASNEFFKFLLDNNIGYGQWTVYVPNDLAMIAMLKWGRYLEVIK